MIETATPGFRSVGQATARRIAVGSAQHRQSTQSLLVHGPPGAGKRAFVDDLLALAFCTDGDLARRPCNACRGCRDARARSHADLVTGSPDAWREERSTGESIVAAARRWLLAAAGAPVQADRRVVLIEHADRANEQIQNALLKALEEPTDRHLFVLVADEPARLLPTIRSRCRPLRIGPVARADLVAHLMDVRNLPADLAEALARLSNGLAGTAMDLADHREVIDWRRRVQLQLLDVLERGPAERFAVAGDILDEAARLNAPQPVATDDDGDMRTPAAQQRSGAVLVVEAWLALARDLLVAGAGRSDLAPGEELSPELGQIGSRIGSGPILDFIRLLERIHDGLLENAAPRLALETAMLRWPRLAR